MKGKNTFTQIEIIELKDLIRLRVNASRPKQKTIRAKMRRIGFYGQDDFGINNLQLSDFEGLIEAGEIVIKEQYSPVRRSCSEQECNVSNQEQFLVDCENEYQDVETNLILKGDFRIKANLDKKILDRTGFYCIRLKAKSKLPNRYQNLLLQRKFEYIYIGKAQYQSLRSRLEQEVEHKSPGTFFRSIGCILKKTPIPGHLKDKSNQNNFKFSKDDTNEIIDWLEKNVEISIVKFDGDFIVEKGLIKKYSPLLNDAHNPLRLQELKDDRAKCREIARK